MQVVVVTHNVLPIRSLRWQNIPSLLFWSSTSGRRFGDDSLSHALSTLCFVLVACIDDFLLLMYTFLFLREVLFGPKWRPPLLILRRDKYFGQLNLDEGNIKEQWSIITLLSTGRFLIAHLVPIQFNRAHENFEYIGLSVEPDSRTQQTWGAPISGRRQDLTLELRCAIRLLTNYVIRLKAGGAWVAASQCNAWPKSPCKSISVCSWVLFFFHR